MGSAEERQAQPESHRWGRRNLTTFCAGAALNDTGQEMVTPYLAPFALNLLGASPILWGIILSVEEAANRLFKFFTGAISDRHGRKPPIIGAYGSIAAHRVGIAASVAWWQLIPFITLRQFGRALRDPAREASIAESFAPEARGRAFGLLSMVDTIGAVAGPLLALVLLAWFTYGEVNLSELSLQTRFDEPSAYRAVFLLAAIPTAISALLITLFLIETRKPTRATGGVARRSYWTTLREGWTLFKAQPRLRTYTVGNFFFAFGAVPIFAVIGYVTAVREGLGFSPAAGGLLFVFYALALSFASLPAGFLVDRVGRRAGQLLGDLVAIGYLLGVAFARSFLALVAVFVLYGIFEALWITSRRAVVADLAPPQARAQALGLFSMVYGISLMIAPLLFGILWSVYSVQVAALVAAGICTGAMLYLLIATRGHQGLPSGA